MFKKINRLNKKKDFERIFKTGRPAYCGAIGIKASVNDLGYSRFGIIIGTKVSKKAVIRNKIKRQIRNIIRKYTEEEAGNHDFVIICRPAIIKSDYKDIKRSLLGLFKRLKLR